MRQNNSLKIYFPVLSTLLISTNFTYAKNSFRETDSLTTTNTSSNKHLICDNFQERKNRKNLQNGSNENNLNTPINMNNFPGVGSIDAWKASVPEAKTGNDCMKQQKWDEAIMHYKASLALYEYQPHAWLEIGKAIEAKGGLISDAEEAYRKCLKLNTQSWKGWKALANVLYMQKRYDEAREAISNALQLNVPPKEKASLDKIVVLIESGVRDANTSHLNTGQ